MEVVAVKYQNKCAQTKISDSKNPLFNKSNEHVQVMKKKISVVFYLPLHFNYYEKVV